MAITLQKSCRPKKIKGMDPFISIITVSLKAAATIDDTIASVAYQQASFGVELVCVDGGSTDGTRDIIDRWAARKMIPIRSIYESDNGIYDAMNKGLKAARGEYVLFLNADDFLVSPTTLARAMEGLTPGAAQNPDIIVGDASMGILGRRGIWRHRRVPSLLGRLRGWGLFPVHQGQLTKRRIMQDTGGFDSRLKLASDTNKFYDLECEIRPTVRRLGFDVVFMRAGGAANASLLSMRNGTVEIYKHLSQRHHIARALGMVIVKSMQSLSEVRVGRCPHRRWFADTNSEPLQ
jgi:glycosyltransferase involved in cell wall biosynthesis